MTPEDVGRIEKWFTDYCRSFYSDDEDVQRNVILKEKHTYRVKDNIAEIVREEGLPAENVIVAEAIGLLHDVGRFEQYRQFRTFKDSISINHAKLGVKIIEEHDVLNQVSSAGRSCIMSAVEYHNAFAIPEFLGEEATLFLKLIRDADKLDIWQVFVEYFCRPEKERPSAAGLGLPDEKRCSPDVLAQSSKGKMVQLSTLKTLDDFKILQLSWVYDLNFTTSFKLVSQRGLLNELIATIPSDPEVAEAVSVPLKFLGERATGETMCGGFRAAIS